MHALQHPTRMTLHAIRQACACTGITCAGVRTQATAVQGEETTSSLRELTKDDFHSFIKEAGSTLVVVDFYTDWCA